MDPENAPDAITAMQAQIAELQQQLANAHNAFNNLANNNPVNQNANANQSVLKLSKPEKFDGKHVRSWLVSLENIFNSTNQQLTDENKIKYAISFMIGNALQWHELMKHQNKEFQNFDEFKNELLNYFEPVNREDNARKVLNSLKQFGKYNAVSSYNQEFSRWLLQIPGISLAEQMFLYKEGLKHNIRIEIEKSDPATLHEAMVVADRMDRIYSRRNFGNNYNSFNRNNNNNINSGPTPMEIGNIGVRLSEAEKRRRIQHKLCFVCGKPNCIARNHQRNGNRNGNKQNRKNWNSPKN